jgi:hypothetical protein
LLFEFNLEQEALDVHVQGEWLYFAAWPYFGRCSTSGCLQDGGVDLGARPAVSVATDPTFLYVSAWGWSEITRCDVPDCNNEVVLSTGISAISVAVDSAHLYLAVNGARAPTTENAYIGRCPIAGCGDGGTPEVLEATDVSPYAIAVDDERIYYTNFVHGTVVSRPK